jgi:peroxiredoxin family protein
MTQKGVPPFRQLFRQAAELGDAQLLPCSMAIDLLKITGDDLDPEFGPPTGLTRFLSDSEAGQLLTF